MQTLRRSEEGLPFFVRRSPSRTFSGFKCARQWRLLQRSQRSLLTVVLIGSVLGIIYLFSMISTSTMVNDLPSLSAQRTTRKSSGKIVQEIPPPAPLGGNGRENRPNANDLPPADEAAQNAGDQQPKQVEKPRYPKFKGPENERQRAVVAAFQHAWKNYKQFAWGHDQLKPISKGFQEWFGTGLTIVDSLDTIIVMGLEKEFEDAKLWISTDLHFDNDRFVSFFETTIRMLGGLLSAYHLSGEHVFLEKAEDLGHRLVGAFHNKSRIPFSDVNLKTGSSKQPAWSGASSLSEVSSVQLEFRDLARLTGNITFEVGCAEHKGLCPMYINPTTGQFVVGSTITLGARSDSYYEYLLKQWLQTGKTIDWLLDDYNQAVTAMIDQLVRYTEPQKLAFIGELTGGKTFYAKMDHLTCFMAGTLALGVQNGLSQSHLELAKKLAYTCRKMYENPTGLGPEIAHFNMLPGKEGDLYIKPLDAHCLLRPEAIEAWFYLYRVTGDKEYVEWGWQAFQAIEKHARVINGYASVNNVKKIPVTYRDLMESFFLAETLKYLYLLFADDQSTLLPLNEYVFNTEGHPLKI